MSAGLLETFVFDTQEPRARPILAQPAGTRVNPGGTHAAADPKVAIRSISAPRLMLPVVGKGQVIWLLGGGVDRAAVALAWLLRSQHAGKSLLAELGPAESALPREPVRVSGSNIWRRRAPGQTARLRDWLLFLSDCRSCYTTTILSRTNSENGPRGSLLRLADRVVVLAHPDPASVSHAREVLHEVRRAGVTRSECLWLDAA